MKVSRPKKVGWTGRTSGHKAVDLAEAKIGLRLSNHAGTRNE